MYLRWRVAKKTMLKRTILFIVILEVGYLLLFNAALNIGFTQTLINKIKPEKFQITWQKAWTPYPFKVFLEEGSAWGVSSSQKWKVDVKKASASISLLPLFKHRVKVYDIDTVNVDYFQRPVKIDIKKAEQETFFAPMPDSSSTSEANQKLVEKKRKNKKEKKPWKIDLENIVAKGDHSFWIMQAKGELHGNVQVKQLSIETNSGPFSVTGGSVDVLMHQLQVGKEKEMLSQSKIKGTVKVDPIVFSENKGLKILLYLSFDTDISTQMGSLEVLDIYLHRLEDTSIAGKGRLDGHINLQKGKLLQGTDIEIKADALSFSMKEYTVDGDGKVTAKVSRETPELLDAKVRFDTLKTSVDDADNSHKQIVLFRGRGLALELKGDTSLTGEKKKALKYFSVNIPKVSVDDLAVFQRYVPKKWAFELHGGSGTLQARSVVERGETDLHVQLRSNEAEVGFGRQTFKTNMDLLLKLNVQRDKTVKADLSGSYLSLKDSRIIGGKTLRQNVQKIGIPT